MNRRTKFLISAVAAAGVVAVGGGVAAATDGHKIGEQALNQGVFSIDEQVVNHTCQTWTLDRNITMTKGLGQHWAQQPAAELRPGESEHISAYSNNPFTSVMIQLDYRLPNGEHVTSEMENSPFGPAVDWAGVYTSMAPASVPSGLDKTYQAGGNAGSGGHANYQFDVDGPGYPNQC